MPTDHYGLPDPQIVSGMTGREFLQAMIEGRLPRPPISQTLSFRIVEVGEGFAAFEGDPGPHLLNPMGLVHGGWALTLIDTVTGCAAHSLLAAGVGSTSIETKANFSRPIKQDTGRVRAEGTGGLTGKADYLRARANLRTGRPRSGAWHLDDLCADGWALGCNYAKDSSSPTRRIFPASALGTRVLVARR